MARVRVWSDEHTYVLEGTGAFPFDMLRRERSWPTSTDFIFEMGQGAERRVTLTANLARDIVVTNPGKDG